MGQGGGEKANLRKVVKFSIWNRVMGSQPIRIQLGKILQENLAVKSCGKFLQENLAGKFCRTRRRGKSQFKKGSEI